MLETLSSDKSYASDTVVVYDERGYFVVRFDDIVTAPGGRGREGQQQEVDIVAQPEEVPWKPKRLFPPMPNDEHDTGVIQLTMGVLFSLTTNKLITK